MTDRQLFSVPCPTCGANIGAPCTWGHDGLCLGTHLNRELSAAAVSEPEGNLREASRAADASDSPSLPHKKNRNVAKLIP